MRIEAADTAPYLLVIALIGIAVALALVWLGLPRFDLHPPTHRAGIMDPGCGGTRALRLVAAGDVAGALRWNPASPVLYLGAVATVLRSLAGHATGRWLNVRLPRSRAVVALPVVLVVALEVRQQAIASLLMRPGY